MKTIVVGAGLAGLTCAMVLRERGAEVAVFEASDGVRVRTDEQNGEADTSTLEYLKTAGLSGRYVDSFFRPFYGGIMLNRELTTSARVLRFTLKMLAAGRTVVPALGMGEIPCQLASRLPEGEIQLNSPVEDLLREGERVVGVRSAGREHEADGLGSGRKILLNAEDGAFVNKAVEMSNISEKYAPPDRHFLYAVALTGMDMPDEDLYRRGIEDLSRWYPGADFRPLALGRIPYGQFAQPPGIHSRLPENRTQTPGLVLAGEYTEDSSINGSMLSGEKAARAVIE
jgi:phytoene dehydrogenase-like protein